MRLNKILHLQFLHHILFCEKEPDLKKLQILGTLRTFDWIGLKEKLGPIILIYNKTGSFLVRQLHQPHSKALHHPEGTAHFILSPGQRQDMVVFPELCKNLP